MSAMKIFVKVILASGLLGGLFLMECQGAPQTERRHEPVVKQVDHVVVLSSDPRQLFTLFTETLGLPKAWPFSEYPGFATGGVQMGNVNLEIIHFDKNSRPFYPGAPSLYLQGNNASIFGIVFDPLPLYMITEELRARGCSPGNPVDQMGEYGGRPVKLWTSMFLQALGVDSYIVYLCEYSAGYRKMLEQHAVKPPLGGLGLLSVREIVVGAKDLAATREKWDSFLAPVKAVDSRYALGQGPAVRLAAAADDRIVSLLLEVASLEEARIFLAKNGLLGKASATELTLDPTVVQALEIRLVEKQ